MADEIDAEIKKLQLETAKVELEAKRRDLRNRPGDLRLALTNPVAIAAIIAALVTLSSAIISFVVAGHQKSLEAQRADAQARIERLKFESQLILRVVCTGDPDQAAVNLKFLVEVGLVPDMVIPLTNYLNNRPPHQGKALPVGCPEMH